MVSKALASLDAWLELAERVLQEQREDELRASEEPSCSSQPSKEGEPVTDQRDPDDFGPLLDPTAGPDEPTPEFTPTAEAEELANWVAGIDDDPEKAKGAVPTAE